MERTGLNALGDTGALCETSLRFSGDAGTDSLRFSGDAGTDGSVPTKERAAGSAMPRASHGGSRLPVHVSSQCEFLCLLAYGSETVAAALAQPF